MRITCSRYANYTIWIFQNSKLTWLQLPPPRHCRTSGTMLQGTLPYIGCWGSHHTSRTWGCCTMMGVTQRVDLVLEITDKKIQQLKTNWYKNVVKGKKWALRLLGQPGQEQNTQFCQWLNIKLKASHFLPLPPQKECIYLGSSSSIQTFFHQLT